MNRPNVLSTASKFKIKILSVALLSRSKKSNCDIVQPSSCIVGDNVPNKQYARTTARNQCLDQLEAYKTGNRMGKKTEIISSFRAYYVSTGSTSC